MRPIEGDLRLYSAVDLRDLGLEARFASPLQRQQLGEARDLRSQAGERRVLAGNLLRQKELRHHEHGEQKDDRLGKQRFSDFQFVAGCSCGDCQDCRV